MARPSSPACPEPKLLGSEKRLTIPLSVRSISVICIVMIIAYGSPVLPSSPFADVSKNVRVRLTETARVSLPARGHRSRVLSHGTG